MLPPALQSIADELAAWRARVLDEVAGLSQRQSDWQPGSEGWSVGEALHHLVTAESIGGRLISVNLRRAEDRGPLLRYPDEIEAFSWEPPTADDRWLVRVPEPAAPTPGQPIDGLREAMVAQARLTEAVVQRLADSDPRAVEVAHPIIGEMNLTQWVRFASYHMRIHLRQIRETKAAPGFPQQ